MRSAEKASPSIQPGRRCTHRPPFHVKRWLDLHACVGRSPSGDPRGVGLGSRKGASRLFTLRDRTAAWERAASRSPGRSPVSNSLGLPKGHRGVSAIPWRESETGSRNHHGRSRDGHVGFGVLRSGVLVWPHRITARGNPRPTRRRRRRQTCRPAHRYSPVTACRVTPPASPRPPTRRRLPFRTSRTAAGSKPGCSTPTWSATGQEGSQTSEFSEMAVNSYPIQPAFDSRVGLNGSVAVQLCRRNGMGYQSCSAQIQRPNHAARFPVKPRIMAGPSRTVRASTS